MNIDWIKWLYFWVNELEVSVNDSIFSSNEQQKVYFKHALKKGEMEIMPGRRVWVERTLVKSYEEHD